MKDDIWTARANKSGSNHTVLMATLIDFSIVLKKIKYFYVDIFYRSNYNIKLKKNSYAAPSRKYNCLDLLHLMQTIFMSLYKEEKIKSDET